MPRYLHARPAHQGVLRRQDGRQLTLAAKGKRKRNKVGRPYDDTAPRTPSGQKSRAREPKENMTLVAQEARQRVFGLTPWQSADPLAESALGRLRLRKVISHAQKDAGDKYRKKHDAAMRAIKAPLGLQVTNKAGDGGDIVTADYVSWSTAAVAEFKTLRAALRDIKAEATVELVVIHDDEPLDSMLPALKEGLDLLSKRL